MTYEYKCEVCGKIIEVSKPAAEYNTPEFHCGKEMHKTYSAPSIKFVGSGFYVNDYK
jgi:putative FmdB family regulatory protein